jgi:hypothetical protein
LNIGCLKKLLISDKSRAVNIKGVQLGAIAQELQKVLPDCVKEEMNWCNVT